MTEAEIKTLLASSLSNTAIGIKLKRDESAVRRLRRKYNIPSQKKDPTMDGLNEGEVITLLRNPSISNDEIKKALGIGDRRLRSLRKKYNLPGKFGSNAISRDAKILFLDIETFPNIIASWGVWETDSLEVIEDWIMCCIALKWQGEEETKVIALPDFRGYKPNVRDDKALCEAIKPYLDEADVVVAHNGDRFDIKKINARFIVNGIEPPKPYKSVDTRKVAKKHFGFDSNKLNEIARQAQIGSKLQTGGYDLWKGCMKGDLKAWERMKEYNVWDVILLEKVYNWMRGWQTTHPNLNFITRANNCPTCQSKNIRQQETADYKRTGWKNYWKCGDCGRHFTGELERHASTLLG